MARTDNDSWDLATSVGATATMVAAARAAASRRPNAIIHDPFAEPLVRAVDIDFFTGLASGELDFAEIGGDAESGWMPDVFAVRARFFDNFFESASDAGIRQVVIVASGWTRVPTGCRGRPARPCTRSISPR
jgi:methyltransferase (TIGR00027 family)